MSTFKLYFYIGLFLHVGICQKDFQIKWNEINLPNDHLPIFFTNNPKLKQSCKEDQSCPYKVSFFRFILYKI